MVSNGISVSIYSPLYIPWFFAFIARFRTGSAVPHLAAFWTDNTIFSFFFAIAGKNRRLTPFDVSRFKPYKTEKSSRKWLLSTSMWHRTRAWLFLYIYFIYTLFNSYNAKIVPLYPFYSRPFPFMPLCDIECAPPQSGNVLLSQVILPAWIPHSGRQSKS